MLCCTLAVLGAAGSARAEAELRKLFPLTAPVEAQGAEGLPWRLELPAEVLAACRPDLSDLRLLDAAGEQVPFAIDRGPSTQPLRSSQPRRTLLRRVPAEVLGVKQRQLQSPHAPNVTEELYELRSPPPGPGVWQLVAETAAPGFVRQVVILSGSLARPVAELASASLFRLRDGHGERLRMTLPQLPGKRFLVRLTGEASVALEPRWVFEAVELLPPERVARVPLSLRQQRTQGTVQHVDLSRPAGIVPSALRIETSTEAFERHLVVSDRGQGSRAGSLGAGHVFRLPALGPAGGAPAPGLAESVEELELPLSAARGEWLEVSIDNGDSPALEGLSFSALIHSPSLLFWRAGGAGGQRQQLTLYFGGGRVSAARYDLGRLLQTAATAEVGESQARVLSVQPNPVFDRTPALGFALRPGAVVDERPYARQRALQIASAPDGLARLALGAAELAVLRPDLGDLRVVDAERRQWPFLIEHERRSELVTLEPAEASGAQRSRRALALPVAPLAPTALLLEPRDSYFDRAYRIEGKTEAGERVTLASGRARRSQGASGPIEIELTGARVVSLELEMEDGDNAPLGWRSVQARVPLPELYVLAPPGNYRLLLDNPQASPPRYDIERARELVLSVASELQAPGPLGDNPGFRSSARFASGDGAVGAVLWGVLGLAVIVLGGLTFRLARQRPNAG